MNIEEVIDTLNEAKRKGHIVQTNNPNADIYDACIDHLIAKGFSTGAVAIFASNLCSLIIEATGVIVAPYTFTQDGKVVTWDNYVKVLEGSDPRYLRG